MKGKLYGSVCELVHKLQLRVYLTHSEKVWHLTSTGYFVGGTSFWLILINYI
jgi:hypothetical protein